MTTEAFENDYHQLTKIQICADQS